MSMQYHSSDEIETTWSWNPIY